MSRSRLLLLTSMALAALALPAVVSGNAASPWQEGDVVGEPNGELRDMSIEREELSIDLRPLADGAPVPVTATYHLVNNGAPARLDLVFVAAGLTGDATGVWLDGAQIPVSTADPGTGSPPGNTWRTPATTPGLNGGKPIHYGTQSPGSLRFMVDVPAGAHDMTVRYLAEASAYSGDLPARYWQLGYVLAPAREWGGFGTLDVSVELPPGWSFASDPPLERTGDTARASFPGIPADAIAMTAQMPLALETGPNYVPAIVVATLSVVGLLLAAWLGGRRGRTGRSAGGLIGVCIAWSVLTAIGFVAATMATNPRPTIPASQGVWGYSGTGAGLLDFLSTIMIVILILILLTIGMRVVASLASRRARPPTQLSPAT